LEAAAECVSQRFAVLRATHVASWVWENHAKQERFGTKLE
jgi:hypothetical protein